MNASESIIAARSELRKRSLATRDSSSPEWRHSRSAEILARLDQHLGSRNMQALHCYLSFRSEVETREFIERTLEKGIRVIVPAVEETGSEGETAARLAHVELHDVSDLVKGRFGIEEPAVRSLASLEALEALDVVIVPLVAFDRHGTRLGYGKGFYDMFLHELPANIERIGLAFSIQEVERIPALPHDEPLHTIITEHEVIRAH